MSKTVNKFKNAVSKILGLLSLVGAILIIVLIIKGAFPYELFVFGKKIAIKNIRKPFLFAFILFLASLFLSEERGSKIWRLKDGLERLCSNPFAIWVIALLYAGLFAWQQVTEYFTMNVNFLDFSFFDYGLYNTLQGKFMFTADLHGWLFRAHFYPIVLILLPLVAVFKSPLFLVIFHGVLVASAVVPFYFLARLKFKESFVPMVLALTLLNYFYVFEILQFNFHVEAFYPLIIFSAFYFALTGKDALFFLFLALGLMVKEESPVYFMVIGLYFTLFQKKPKLGLGTMLVSALYFVLSNKVILPLFNNAMPSLAYTSGINASPWPQYGSTHTQIVLGMLSNPLALARDFLSRPVLYRLFKSLLFVPLFTPAACLWFLPLLMYLSSSLPLYNELSPKYANAIYPLIFIALVYGLSNLAALVGEKRRQNFLWLISCVFILLNFGHYSVYPISGESLNTYRMAKSVPQSANLVTMGNLVPQTSYREHNVYFAESNETKPCYSNADYYYLVKNINLYPVNLAYVENTITRLKSDPRYELVYYDNNRYLFKNKTYSENRVA
ncbi:MAG: DUF2079 domain-containing protein [Candidatus Omnitrophica bacterium]|nr:DUF2079 domain-containing protein [Candidatus Omnitrophota bacterium]